MDPTDDPPRLQLRLRFGAGQDMLGWGKAELLERIDATGSIAAAARDMDMSYKRAWSLIETLNDMFDAPLVVSTRGGRGTGGAVLTDRGRAVLAEYRAVEALASQSAGPHLRRIQSWLRPRAADPGQGH